MKYEYLTTDQISDMGLRYADMVEEGHSNSDVRSFITEEVRSGFDHDIWVHVDDDPELDFDEALEEVMDEIEAQADYYIEQREEAKEA